MEKRYELHFEGILEQSGNSLWGYHVVIPADVLEQMTALGIGKRIICRINNTIETQSGIIPWGEGRQVVMLNKSIRDRLKINPGTSVHMEIGADESTYGLPMSDELAEVLHQDPEGNHLFHALTPGKQRSLIYWAGLVKNTDGRIKRALAITNHLKATNGKVNFRQLQDSLKN